MGNAAEAALNEAQQALATGDSQQAFSHFNEAVMLAPENLRALQGRGMLLHNMKRHQEALADFDIGISMHPEPFYYLQKSETLVEMGRGSEGIDVAKTGVDLGVAKILHTPAALCSALARVHGRSACR
jgi:tetratricopeptide (TPR) repeat protein